VDDDLDEPVVRVERQLDLAEVVVGVGVVEREADEAFDDRGDPPGVVGGNPGRGGEGGEKRRHQHRRARVAEDGDLHVGHERRC
jgi:hypothetical protein